MLLTVDLDRPLVLAHGSQVSTATTRSPQYYANQLQLGHRDVFHLNFTTEAPLPVLE